MVKCVVRERRSRQRASWSDAPSAIARAADCAVIAERRSAKTRAHTHTHTAKVSRWGAPRWPWFSLALARALSLALSVSLAGQHICNKCER